MGTGNEERRVGEAKESGEGGKWQEVRAVE